MLITIHRGLTLSAIDIAVSEDGVAKDLTGWSVFADACRTPASVAAFSLNPTIPAPLTGVVTIPEKTPADTMQVPAGEFTFDVILQSPTGQRLAPIVTGLVQVRHVNTKPTSA